MKKYTTHTLGSRLNNATTIATVLKEESRYIPIRKEDSVESLDQLLASIHHMNGQVAQTKQLARNLLEQKQELYFNGDNSLRKLLTLIHGSVKAQYGLHSKTARTIGAKIREIRGGYPVKNIEPNPEAIPAAAEKTAHHSHMSFNALMFHFNELIIYLDTEQIPFAPSNPVLTIQNLQAMHAHLNEISLQQYMASLEYSKSLHERNILYAELKERVLRIKQSVLSQFGSKSSIYTTIKSLRI